MWHDIPSFCFRTSIEDETRHAGDKEWNEEDVGEDETEEEEEEVIRGFHQQTAAVLPESDTTQLCTRRIIAEDPSWTLTIVQSLTDICTRHIADNFCC